MLLSRLPGGDIRQLVVEGRGRVRNEKVNRAGYEWSRSRGGSRAPPVGDLRLAPFEGVLVRAHVTIINPPVVYGVVHYQSGKSLCHDEDDLNPNASIATPCIQ